MPEPNTIAVDRGDLYEILFAARALLEGHPGSYTDTTPQGRQDDALAAVERLTDELLG